MRKQLRWVVSLLIVTLATGSLNAQLLDDARKRAMTSYRLGLESMRSEAWAEAQRRFEEAIEIDPGFEMAHYALGRTHLAQKLFGRAVAALAKCRDLYQQQGSRRFANQQEAQRYRRESMQELDEVIRQYSIGPQNMQTQENVRQLNERKRQLQMILDRGNNFTIEAAVPGFVSLSLGSAYFRRGQFADAEREYKAALASDSKIGEAYSNLAVVYLETGRADEADKALKAAEKVGFKVHPQLKADIQAAKKKTS